MIFQPIVEMQEVKFNTRARAVARDYLYMKDQKEIISVLDELIETLKDGQEGFRQAADAVKDSHLKSVFDQYSQQRSRFATELQNQGPKPGRAKPRNGQQRRWCATSWLD